MQASRELHHMPNGVEGASVAWDDDDGDGTIMKGRETTWQYVACVAF